MTDKQYKTADLRLHPEPARPAGYNGRGGGPLERWWWTRHLQAQDTAPASTRRLVCEQHMTTQEWLVVDGTDPTNTGSTQVYPDSTTERIAARAMFCQAAGSVLEVRALCLPFGPTQEMPDTSWILDEYGGTIKVDGSWTSESNTNTDAQETNLTAAAGVEDYGGLPSGNGAYWNVIRPVYAEWLAPEDRDQPEEAADYSEGTRCELTVSHIGGVRTIHTSVCERPYIHATDHDTLEATAHTWPESLSNPHPEPRTEGADGSTYDERRFGTSRSMAVVERQRQRLGPILWTWHNYLEGQAVDVTEALRNTSSDTFVGIIDNNVTAWGADEAGFAMPGHYAIPRDRQVVSQRIGLIPVRIWVYGLNTTASETGEVQVQTSARSWITVTVSDSLAWYTTTGYLECQRTSDDGTDYANAVPLFRRESGSVTCRVHAIICEYGAFAYG